MLQIVSQIYISKIMSQTIREVAIMTKKREYCLIGCRSDGHGPQRADIYVVSIVEFDKAYDKAGDKVLPVTPPNLSNAWKSKSHDCPSTGQPFPFSVRLNPPRTAGTAVPTKHPSALCPLCALAKRVVNSSSDLDTGLLKRSLSQALS